MSGVVHKDAITQFQDPELEWIVILVPSSLDEAPEAIQNCSRLSCKSTLVYHTEQILKSPNFKQSGCLSMMGFLPLHMLRLPTIRYI